MPFQVLNDASNLVRFEYARATTVGAKSRLESVKALLTPEILPILQSSGRDSDIDWRGLSDLSRGMAGTYALSNQLFDTTDTGKTTQSNLLTGAFTSRGTHATRIKTRWSHAEENPFVGS